MVPEAVGPSKFDEAKAALERGAFDEALHLLEFRRDRESGRPQALAILNELAIEEPTNKQVPFTIRKIERPCERCGDTGFCPHCKGRGKRRFLGLDRKCERCYGRGICPVCGVL